MLLLTQAVLSGDFAPMSVPELEYATYLPAVSNSYVNNLNRPMVELRGARGRSIPGYEITARLNFLNRHSGRIHYPYALYSAGHAQLDLEKSAVQERVLYERDRSSTILLTDSGGFQLIKGVLKIDWDDEPAADAMRLKILRWIEAIADRSITLDVPLAAIDRNPNFWNFDRCLSETVKSLRFFADHRQKEVPFLNALHGNDDEQGEAWFKAVKDFPFQGWAFAGRLKGSLERSLARLRRLLDDGYLDGKERYLLHFLGIEQPHMAVAYTAVKRTLRARLGNKIDVTFDASNPFSERQFGTTHTHWGYDPKKPWVKLHSFKRFRYEDAAFLEDPYSPRSMLLEGVQREDLFVPGSGGRYGLDTLAELILTLNNLYVRASATQTANAISDHELGISTLVRESKLGPAGPKMSPLGEIQEFVTAYLTSASPGTMLEVNRPLLRNFVQT